MIDHKSLIEEVDTQNMEQLYEHKRYLEGELQRIIENELLLRKHREQIMLE